MMRGPTAVPPPQRRNPPPRKKVNLPSPHLRESAGVKAEQSESIGVLKFFFSCIDNPSRTDNDSPSVSNPPCALSNESDRINRSDSTSSLANKCPILRTHPDFEVQPTGKPDPNSVIIKWLFPPAQYVEAAGTFTDPPWAVRVPLYCCPISSLHWLNLLEKFPRLSGSYQYKLIVDGVWRCDPFAPICDDGSEVHNLNNFASVMREPIRIHVAERNARRLSALYQRDTRVSSRCSVTSAKSAGAHHSAMGVPPRYELDNSIESAWSRLGILANNNAQLTWQASSSDGKNLPHPGVASHRRGYSQDLSVGVNSDTHYDIMSRSSKVTFLDDSAQEVEDGRSPNNLFNDFDRYSVNSITPTDGPSGLFAVEEVLGSPDVLTNSDSTPTSMINPHMSPITEMSNIVTEESDNSTESSSGSSSSMATYSDNNSCLLDSSCLLEKSLKPSFVTKRSHSVNDSIYGNPPQGPYKPVFRLHRSFDTSYDHRGVKNYPDQSVSSISGSKSLGCLTNLTQARFDIDYEVIRGGSVETDDEQDTTNDLLDHWINRSQTRLGRRATRRCSVASLPDLDGGSHLESLDSILELQPHSPLSPPCSFENSLGGSVGRRSISCSDRSPALSTLSVEPLHLLQSASGTADLPKAELMMSSPVALEAPVNLEGPTMKLQRTRKVTLDGKQKLGKLLPSGSSFGDPTLLRIPRSLPGESSSLYGALPSDTPIHARKSSESFNFASSGSPMSSRPLATDRTRLNTISLSGQFLKESPRDDIKARLMAADGLQDDFTDEVRRVDGKPNSRLNPSLPNKKETMKYDKFGLRQAWPPKVLELMHGHDIFLELEIPKSVIRAETHLTLSWGTCVIPRQGKMTCADAVFASAVRGGSIGVADGVGEWEHYGINPSQFSLELIHQCKLLMETISLGDRSVNEYIREVMCEAYNSTTKIGSSTCLLVCFDKPREHLAIANLGDSCCCILRRSGKLHKYRVLFRAREQQHRWNMPFQLSRFPRPEDYAFLSAAGNDRLVNVMKENDGMLQMDMPSDCEVSSVRVYEGDIVLVGSDGVFDNLFEHELISIANMCVSPAEAKALHNPDLATSAQAIATTIAEAAEYRSRDLTAKSPFSVAARNNSTLHTGGKLDDIAVVVAWVCGTPPQVKQ
eukprot:GHVH01003403.1.p1 GENE.GHVH01003403.1~~GHVH01003403.1.p1  ORF type:complete len:1143 (+),score=182.60 GHVH01003403.1:263-3691(+)